MALVPFFRYYGGKRRAARMYPPPLYPTIVAPFAGAEGYGTLHHRHSVILVEKNPQIAEMWRWLIAARRSDVVAIPATASIDDLPAWVPAGARTLVGFSLNTGTVGPRLTLSSGLRAMMERGRTAYGWTETSRARIAAQVEQIDHWRIIEGDYSLAPDVEATWFIDPPYNNAAGQCYPCGPDQIDYSALGEWCKARRGQVMVCENVGADWLPFRPFTTLRRGLNNETCSREAIWTNGPMGQGDLFAATLPR